jgi:hypothetical protein
MPLMRAAMYGHTDAVALLLQLGAAVNAQDGHGSSRHAPLRNGVGVGRRRITPAGSEAASCGRWSALHAAAIYNHADVTCALLIAGANEGITDKYGYGSRFRAGGRVRPEGQRNGRCGVQQDSGGRGEGSRQSRGLCRRRQAGAAAGAPAGATVRARACARVASVGVCRV